MRIQQQLFAVQSAIAALQELDAAVTEHAAMATPSAAIADELERQQRYHRARLAQTFRAALGVDIRPLLLDPFLSGWMHQRIAENVALIVTIPERAHEGLRKRIIEAFQEAPFDQQALRKLVRDEFKSSGYNLRRIVRDQTNKLIGELTQIRQQQLGVSQYSWLTAQDERVRPTHVSKSGLIFRWDAPPPDTGHPGHDIQCRCLARPVLTSAERERLLQNAGPSSIEPRAESWEAAHAISRGGGVAPPA